MSGHLGHHHLSDVHLYRRLILTSMLACSADFTTLGNTQNVARLSLNADLAAAFATSALCGSATSAASVAASANSSFTAYGGISSATTMAYGASGSVYVPPDAVKFDIQSAGW